MKRLCAGLLIVLSVVSSSHAETLTLEQNVNVALQKNPSVLASQKRVNAANARLGQALGAFLPNIQLSGNYGQSYAQPSTVQFTTQTTLGAVTQTLTFGTDATQTTKGWQASLNQPLFVAALFPGYKIAINSLNLAKEDLRKTQLETAFNTTQAYFQVLAAEHLVALAKESKQMAESHLAQVRTMYAAGAAAQTDLLRSDVQVANAEVTLTRATNQLGLVRDSFNNVLGRDLEEEVNLTEEGFGKTIDDIPGYKQLLQLAEANRPDWRQFILTKEISEENLRVAQAARLPTLMLSGKSGNQIVEYPSYSSDVNSWSVTGAASWTLFDGLGIQNRIREAAANLEEQRASEAEVKNGIALEVRNACLNLQSLTEALGSTKKAVEASQENYAVATRRYNSGVGTNSEVLDAQVTLTQARINDLQARFDLEIARAKINKVVGKGVL
ncbi:hypothetical protein A3H38_02925 [candidate division WOR-1 bacterium RIFCSPLOWO2_02_FULL_46_20]|uniref:Transporter n=2 Tax=Saganbacteria TaxID=1703751 RepID=A0A1F4R8U6_UNCSA|nr:MAG: hypothetical protein A3H38_02925 [candidate division WOR-1 bacterium RIFCSPLOWO2_02_FULL_46_20]OGC08849.1 MAG: hypothetical protein A3F86_00165 [candidate division WOR-1 bacterium RIFCSPLOWO2_12_FULL_45_9]